MIKIQIFSNDEQQQLIALFEQPVVGRYFPVTLGEKTLR
jgi:hypothetical protein